MKTTLTGHEKIAKRNIINAFNWIVGELENGIEDGYKDEYVAEGLTLEEVKDSVYESAMNDLYDTGSVVYGRAPKEMRFAGEAFCRAVVDECFEKEATFLIESMGWNKTEDTKEDKKMTVKDLREEAKALGLKGISRMKREQLEQVIEEAKAQAEFEVEHEAKAGAPIMVTMKAFTGMTLGEFEVVTIGSEIVIVATKKGEMAFDRNTGVQLHSNNPRFANKIERVK